MDPWFCMPGQSGPLALMYWFLTLRKMVQKFKLLFINFFKKKATLVTNKINLSIFAVDDEQLSGDMAGEDKITDSSSLIHPQQGKVQHSVIRSTATSSLRSEGSLVQLYLYLFYNNLI